MKSALQVQLIIIYVASVCGNHQCVSNFTLCFEQQHTSPLHTAVLHNHTEVVRLLIDAECDLDISDNVSNVSTLWALQ